MHCTDTNDPLLQGVRVFGLTSIIFTITVFNVSEYNIYHISKGDLLQCCHSHAFKTSQSVSQTTFSVTLLEITLHTNTGNHIVSLNGFVKK